MVAKRGSSDTDKYGMPDGLIKALRNELSGKSTEQDALKSELLANLKKLGGQTVQDDAVVFAGTKIQLPAKFNGDYLAAARFLEELDEQENQEYAFGRKFKFRPWDGAAAFDRAMKSVFGTAGLGRATVSMFGSRPPELISITVGPGKQLQVPWGKVEMPAIEATFSLSGMHDPEFGALFYLHVVSPRRNRAALEGFFDVVQHELETNSIYRGNAFDGAEEPEFLDLSWVNDDKVVYSDEVIAQLEANVWSLLRYTDKMRELGMPLKRAILLEGPFGTGKTLAGALTAKIAKANGWTFILARPGKDDIFEVLNTAKLYAPAVVQFEDIDTVAKGGSDEEISRLLDALDGIGNKGSGVVALFTTNHVENIQQAVMRPGRIDSIIHIGALDRNGVEKLVRSVINPKLLGNVDFDVVYSQMSQFLPAFVKEATDRAVRYSLSRNAGVPNTIETEDLVNSAIGLQRQLDLMNSANEGAKEVPTVDAALTAIVAKVQSDITNGTNVLDPYGDYNGKLKVTKK